MCKFIVLFFFLQEESPSKIQKADTLFFEGDIIQYVKKEEKIFIFGNAVLKYKNIILIADTIEFRKNEDLLIAYPDPLLISDKDTLKGDYMRFHVKTQKGFSFKGKSHVDKGFIWGDKIYRTEKKVVKGFGSYFTTCNNLPPHYYFYSPRMKITLEDMAVAKPVFMEIQEVPFLWAPFWMFPVTSKRKSGFMTPHPGRNSILGLYIRNLSYYWAMSNYSDITLSLDLFEKKGPRIGTDFTYIYYKKLQGNIKGTYAREIDTRRERWNITGNHYGVLPFSAIAQAQIDFVSDERYALEYSEIRTEKTKSEAQSFLSITRNWKTFSMGGQIFYTNDFVNKRETAELPSLSLVLFSKTIGPFTINGGSSYKRTFNKFQKDTITEKDTTSTRWENTNNARIRYQKVFMEILSFSTGLSFSGNIFDYDTAGNSFPFVKGISSNSGFSTKIYGLSWFGIPPFKKFRHTLSLSSVFNYAPKIKNPTVYKTGGIIGTQEQIRNISFNIGNDYEGKIIKGEEVKKLVLLATNISFSYDLKPEAQRKLSNIFLTGTLLPGFPLNGNFSLFYYTDEKKWKDLRISLSSPSISFPWIPLLLFGKEKKDTVSVDTTKTDTSREKKSTLFPEGGPWNLSFTFTYANLTTELSTRLNLHIRGKITSNWSFSWGANYDFETMKFVDQSLTLSRDLHCFTTQVSWSRFGTIWDYEFRIWIKALPDIKVERGFFETLLPALQE